MIIEKSEFAAKLAKVKAAVPAKTSIPSLQGVLVKGDQIIANNLEIGIRATLSVETEDPFILPPKAIDMIANLPDGEIDVRPSSDNVVTIIMDGIKNTFPSIDPEQFTEPAATDKIEGNLKISSKKLHEMASSVLYAASTNEARPATTGALFEAADGELNVVALDGYRAAWNKTSFDGDFKLIIPRASLDKLLRLGMSGDIEISYSERNAVFTSEAYTVYTRLLSGEFFDYKKAFPTYESEVVVNRKAFQEGIGRILICDDGTKKPAVITFAGEKMTVAIKTGTAEYSEEIEIHGDADEKLRIGFNALYLRDALKSYDAEHVTMSFGTELQPMVMSDDELLSLLLPVRLQS